MKHLCKLGQQLAATILACIALDATALTLGRVRGAALLGQPLKLSVAIEPSADEDAASACLNARVFYGDIQQPPNQVTVNLAQGANQSYTALIYARAEVSEPVVTVELNVGCGPKTSRRYVLFADLASNADGQATALRPTAAPVPDAAAGGVIAPKAPALELPAKEPVNTKPRNGGIEVPAVPEELRSPASLPKPKKIVARSDSKLKLASPVEGAERPVELKTSTQLTAAPSEDLQKRLEAIALWKSLTLTAQEVQENDARVQTLEADLKALQAVTLRNRQNVQLLTGALEKADSGRYTHPLVYSLAALLAAILAVAAYVLKKSRSTNASPVPWSGGADSQAESAAPAKIPAAKSVLPLDQQEPEPATAKPQPTDFGNATDVDTAVGDSVLSSAAAAVPPDSAGKQAAEPRRVDKRDFAASGAAGLREINTAEMLDVRQQAEFFMALGQHDEAVRLLESSVGESAENNPLVYLDLLKLLHTLSRKSEFDRYRIDFNRQFTGVVPSYTSFLVEGNGLETYAEICNQIVDLWPSDDALEFIEMCMLRQPQDHPDQGFDLEAFRDLLTLHGLLRRLDADLDSVVVPFSASRLNSHSHTSSFGVGAHTGHDDQLDIATAPLPPIPHAEPYKGRGGHVDLDLTDVPSNLMEFDIEELASKPRTPEA